jgi:U4/U6.U5 tri-snRNP-associated protein 2
MKVEEGSEGKVQPVLCPYLDTVNRAVLDFDFEKACCVSGNNFNVYACLVCGKYYQGRGRATPAYLHSLQEDHHVVMNLHTGQIYCLPDGYEVFDASLADIRDMLDPRFSAERVASLDREILFARAIDGGDYLPGAIGLNNIRGTDYVNVVVQCLVRIPPLRNFFLEPANYASAESALVQQFGLLVRKVWSPHNFKGQVSPHELMQAVAHASAKRFAIGKQADAHDFLSWLLNGLHAGLGGTAKRGSSIIHAVFQGEVRIRLHARQKKRKAPSSAADAYEGRANPPAPAAADADDGGGGGGGARDAWTVTDSLSPFLFLTLDVPPMPLFRDALDRNIIPQVPLAQCMAKFDGETFQELMNGDRRQFRVTRWPPFLLVHIKRFSKNTQQVVEKNHTIVNCAIKNLDLTAFCEPAANGGEGGADGSAAPQLFDLICSAQHDGKPADGTYKAYVHFPANETWYEMQDLHVQQIHPQLISVSESYLQIYARKGGDAAAAAGGGGGGGASGAEQPRRGKAKAKAGAVEVKGEAMTD